LGHQIAVFVANRRANDPGLIPHSHRPPVDATEEQSTEAFNRHTQALTWYSTKTQNQYNVLFMGPALALYDELATRGWIGIGRDHFELPTNQLGIQAIARNLEAIGEG
jgi:hypothetical protein